jgi:peptidoglycan/LPS O-acetylase OafA/YrhL
MMTPAQDRHIDALDGLRGVAALTVLVTHLSNQTRVFGAILGEGAGQLGVMLFFALSGFLMARLYIDQALSPSAVLTFYRRRAARIFPLYLLLVLASACLTIGLHSNALFAIDAAALPKHLLFIRGASVLWTIPVEVQFYAIFPLIWLVSSRFGVGWIALAMVGFAAVTYTGATGASGPPRYLQYFLLGIVVARSDRAVPGWLLGALVAAYVLAFPRVAAAMGIVTGDVWRSPVYLVLVGCLLSSAAASGRSFLAHPVMRFLGNISYSLYLLHLPVMMALARTPLVQSDFLYISAVVICSISIAAASHAFIERPLRDLITGDGSGQMRATSPAL